MRVAIYQGPAAPGTKAHMLDALRQAAEQAHGADLLVLPELFLTGYNIPPDQLRAAAEPADGPASKASAQIARTHNMALLYGYPEQGAEGALHNSAVLIGPDGHIQANYRKTHLFGDMERAIFTPGTQPAVLATIAGIKIGVLICYDVEFPEMVRGLALRGADLVAVPTALMQPYHFIPQVMVRTRAFENQVFLAYANRTGTEGDMHYVGESCIVAPDGAFLARAEATETLISAELDMAQAANSRSLNTYLADRLPAHYIEPAP